MFFCSRYTHILFSWNVWECINFFICVTTSAFIRSARCYFYLFVPFYIMTTRISKHKSLLRLPWETFCNRSAVFIFLLLLYCCCIVFTFLASNWRLSFCFNFKWPYEIELLLLESASIKYKTHATYIVFFLSIQCLFFISSRNDISVL